jgi:hypothetical protein
MKKVKLRILGLTYSQSHNSAYALLLGEDNGQRQLPIVIGSSEALSIKLALDKELILNRPLSHDLFTTIALTFNLYLKRIVIHKLKEGVFYSYLIFEQNGISNQIDSRTSDAVALALRFNCPIYTSEEILNKAGIVLNEDTRTKEKPFKIKKSIKEKSTTNQTDEIELIRITDTELKKRLTVAVENENYKIAALLRDEIKRRNSHK